MKKFLFPVAFIVAGQLSFSQSLVKDSSLAFSFLGIGAGIHMPSADMAKRFGNNASAGGVFSLKNKKNYTLSITGAYMFGNKIYEEDILAPLATISGNVIGSDGRLAEVRFFERGYHAAVCIGKIFPFKKPNPNSGIWFTLGAGFIQHKIRIENIGNTVNGLSKEYRKGYDRLTNGIQLHEFLGYLFFSNKRLINFYAGFEFQQGFTQSRRDYNFDTMSKDDEKRIDILTGFKVGWILPFYNKPDKFYYN